MLAKLLDEWREGVLPSWFYFVGLIMVVEFLDSNVRALKNIIAHPFYSDINKIESLLPDVKNERKAFIFQNGLISLAAKYGHVAALEKLLGLYAARPEDSENYQGNLEEYSALLAVMRLYVAPMRLPNGDKKTDLRIQKYQNSYALSNRDTSYQNVFFHLLEKYSYQENGVLKLNDISGCSAAWFVLHALEGHFQAKNSPGYKDVCQHKRDSSEGYVKILPETESTEQCVTTVLAVCFLLDKNIMERAVYENNQYAAPIGSSAASFLSRSCYKAEINTIISNAKEQAGLLRQVIRGVRLTGNQSTLVTNFIEFQRIKIMRRYQSGTATTKMVRLSQPKKGRFDLLMSEVHSDGDESQCKSKPKSKSKPKTEKMKPAQALLIEEKIIIQEVRAAFRLKKRRLVHQVDKYSKPEEQAAEGIIIEAIMTHREQLFPSGGLADPLVAEQLIHEIVLGCIDYEERLGWTQSFFPAIFTGYSPESSMYYCVVDSMQLKACIAFNAKQQSQQSVRKAKM